MYVGVPTDPPRGARRLTARPADPQGLGQPRGGGVPPPFGGGWGSPPPPYSPPNCRTPLGVTHWLAPAPVELWVFAMCPALRGSTVSYAGDAHFPKHSLEYSLNFWSQSKKKFCRFCRFCKEISNLAQYAPLSLISIWANGFLDDFRWGKTAFLLTKTGSLRIS